ncbi:DNA-binding response regulator [Nocardioides sp. dk4132]|uniref:response regulator transcription factor n=1 Tax=unclassified Nocardioides TaxID=2615069 RepID=UPI0012950F3B|nr:MULTISPECIES: response regulator transcription factor [unclassified Nocardioides]MQW75255.1 DNA-binding response regulator [Nocardioides sp. dk4132]QGA07594.1 DNA-binding response regulator [Nocardioides sp. dk884]
MTSAAGTQQQTPPPAPVRLAIANDYEVVVRGLQAMLEPYDDVEITELTITAELNLSPAVILYDTFGRLPGRDPTLAKLVREHRAPVLVFSWRTYPPDVALAHGAAGYLHKSCSADELVKAVVAIHEGHSVLGPATSTHASRFPRRTTWPGQQDGLSPRESEILACISRGMSNQEIAEQSFLSINTVKTHIRSAYRKIGVERRSQAVLWGVSHGLGDR